MPTMEKWDQLKFVLMGMHEMAIESIDKQIYEYILQYMESLERDEKSKKDVSCDDSETGK